MLLTGTEVIAFAGITYRQLDYWTRTGLLRAEPRPGLGGSGYRRMYSRTEARVAEMMGRLVRVGLEPVPAEPIARRLIESPLSMYYVGNGVTIHASAKPSPKDEDENSGHQDGTGQGSDHRVAAEHVDVDAASDP